MIMEKLIQSCHIVKVTIDSIDEVDAQDPAHVGSRALAKPAYTFGTGTWFCVNCDLEGWIKKSLTAMPKQLPDGQLDHHKY